MADKNSYPLRLLLTAIDKVSAPVDRINKKIATMMAPARIAGNALASLGQAAGLERLKDSLSGVSKATKNVWSEASALGTRLVIGGGAAAFGFYEFTQRAIDSGAALAFQSRRLKVGVDDFAAYTFAARKAGIQNEDFAAGLDFFQKARGQAEAGKGSLHGLLQSAWPDLLKQITAAKGTIPALDLVVKGMERLHDPEKRSALAAAAFGRGAVSMANLADIGSAGIARLRTRYMQLTGSQAAFADESRDMVDVESDVEAAWTGTRNALLEPLFPVLQDQLSRFTNWLVGHREDVRTWGRNSAQGVADFAQSLPEKLDAVIAFGRGAKNALQPIASIVGGWPTLFATVGAGILAGPLIGALVQLTGAVVKLGFVLATNPIALMVLGNPATWIAAGAAVLALTAAFKMLSAAQDEAAQPREYAVPTRFKDASAFFRGEERLRGSHATAFDDIASSIGRPAAAAPSRTVPAFAALDLGSSSRPAATPFASHDASSPAAPPLTTPSSREAVANAGRLHPDDLKALSEALGGGGVTVDFRNVPRGTRIAPMSGSTGLNLGVSMAESH